MVTQMHFQGCPWISPPTWTGTQRAYHPIGQMRLSLELLLREQGVSHWCLLLTLGAGQTPIHSNLLLQAQRQDKAIGRVLALKSAGKRPSARDANREPSATRTLLRQ